MALAGLMGCSGDDDIEGRDPVVEILPFETEGRLVASPAAGRAFAGSLTNDLVQAAGLYVAGEPADPPESEESFDPGDPTHRVRGTLAWDNQVVHARVQIERIGREQVFWDEQITSHHGDLSELAFNVAKAISSRLNRVYPPLYNHIADVTGQVASSPMLATAKDSLRTNDIEGLVTASNSLVEQFAKDAAGHALNAWAMMLAWDAEPSNETRLNQFRGALERLRQVDPESPYDELMLAYVYRSSGQPEASRELCSRVLARDDLSNAARAWTLRQRSFAHLQSGNTAAAHDDALEAMRLDPANASTMAALSKVLESLGRIEEAITRSELAVELQPYSWRQHQRLGLVYFRGGRREQAISELRKACELGYNQEACANAAVGYQALGLEADAGAAAQLAGSLTGSRWGYYNLACYQALAGNSAAAIAELNRALEVGFADVLITTDPQLDPLRGDPEFEAIVEAVNERIRARRNQSRSAFPWQS